MKILLAAVLSLGSACCLVGQLKTIQTDTLADPQRVVEPFEAHGETFADTILRLGVVSKAPMGLVLADSKPCVARVEISFASQPLASDLDTLVSQMAVEYSWHVSNGVIVVEPKVVPAESAQLLTVVIPRYANVPSTMNGSGQYLWMLINGVLRPGEGTLMDVLSNPSDAQVPALEMRNATAEEILNGIVVKAGGGAWVLLPAPADKSHLAGKSRIWAFGYSDPDVGNAGAQLCGMVRPDQPNGENSKQ